MTVSQICYMTLFLQGTILNIIQQKEPDYSEADMGKEKEADQVPAVDSENPTFQTTDVMSSLVMVLDKSDTAEVCQSLLAYCYDNFYCDHLNESLSAGWHY